MAKDKRKLTLPRQDECVNGDRVALQLGKFVLRFWLSSTGTPWSSLISPHAPSSELLISIPLVLYLFVNYAAGIAEAPGDFEHPDFGVDIQAVA